MRTILFVCTGNTCRSPMAECLFNALVRQRGLNGVSAASAGLHATEGETASAGALRAMQKRGLSLKEHRARLVTEAMLQDAGLVVGMSRRHVDALLARFPNTGAAMRAFDDPPVCDPFGGDDAAYERAASDIARQLPALLDALRPAVKLCPPGEADEADVMAYRDEFLANGDNLGGAAWLQNHSVYREWLAVVRDNQSELTVRPGLVPASTLLARDAVSGELVGMVDIRHRLNDHLLQYGGHIGYSVRKSCRGRGYATQMLAEALQKCRDMRLERVLVTCDKQNIASARTIQRNGGVLENEVPKEGRLTQRYWISL